MKEYSYASRWGLVLRENWPDRRTWIRHLLVALKFCTSFQDFLERAHLILRGLICEEAEASR